MLRLFLIAFLIIGLAPLVPYLLDRASPELPKDAAGRADIAVSEQREFRIEKSRNGQYVAQGSLNGRQVTMLVDTGASMLALPEKIANRIGIYLQPSDFKRPVNTANGLAYGAATDVRDLKLGPIRLRNVEALVLKDDLLTIPLLGMSVLGQLERFDISDDTLVLVQ